jgi:hypothetical protein
VSLKKREQIKGGKGSAATRLTFVKLGYRPLLVPRVSGSDPCGRLRARLSLPSLWVPPTEPVFGWSPWVRGLLSGSLLGRSMAVLLVLMEERTTRKAVARPVAG